MKNKIKDHKTKQRINYDVHQNYVHCLEEMILLGSFKKI